MKLEAILEERCAQYGDAEGEFSCVAGMWSEYLTRSYGSEVVVRPKDVGLMMVLLKLAREAHRHKDDNILDARGYLELVDRITAREAGSMESV